MSAELTTTGRISLPSTEKPKLSLAELVAPVADDLLTLNDNLQKVSPSLSLKLQCCVDFVLQDIEME